MIERYLILALAIGLCIVLVVTWYHGGRGAQKVTGVELLIIALLLVIGGVLIWRFGPAVANRSGALATRSGHAGAAAAATAVRTAATTPSLVLAKPIPPQSIAVLPFVNMSGDPKNDYFSDGNQGSESPFPTETRGQSHLSNTTWDKCGPMNVLF